MRASGGRQPQARTSCIVEAERVGKNGRRTRRLEIVEVERPKLDYDMPPMPSPRTVSSELEMVSGSSSFLQYKVPRKLFMSECGDTRRRKKRPRKPKVAMETLDEFEFVDQSFLSVSPEVTPRFISESPREGVVSVRPRKTKKQFVIESSGAMEVGEEKMKLETHPVQAMDIVGDDVDRSSGKGKLELSREETFSIESDKKKLKKSHGTDKDDIQKQEMMTQTQKAASQNTAENSEMERKSRREHRKNRHRSYRIDDEDPLSGRRHKTHKNMREEEVVRSRHSRKENEKRRGAQKERQRRDVVRRKRYSESSASFQNSDDENGQKPKNLFESEDDAFAAPRSESTSEDGYAPSQRDESWAPNQPSSRSEKHDSRSVSEVVRKEALTEKNEAKKLPEVVDSVATFQVEEKTESDVSIEVSSDKESEPGFRQDENEKSSESEGDQVQSEAKEEPVSDENGNESAKEERGSDENGNESAKEERVSDEKGNESAKEERVSGENGNESAKENGNHEVVELEKDRDGTSDSSRFFQASDKSESDSGDETNEASDASSPEEGGNWFDGIVTSSSHSNSTRGSETEHVEEVKRKSEDGKDGAEVTREEKECEETRPDESEEKKDVETEKDVVHETEEKKEQQRKDDDESGEKKEDTHESEVEKDVEIEKDELQESEEKKEDRHESDVKKDETSEKDKDDEVEKSKENESGEENASESKSKKLQKDGEVEEKKDDKPEEKKVDKSEEKKDDTSEEKKDDKSEKEKVDQNEEPEGKKRDEHQEEKAQESEGKKDEKEDLRIETKERATPTEMKGDIAEQEQNANTNNDSSEKIEHFFSASESKSDANDDSEAQAESNTPKPSTQSKDVPVSKPFERPSEPDSSAFFKTSAVSGVDSVPPASTEGGQNWFDGIISNSCDTCEPKAVDSNPPAEDSEKIPQIDPPIPEEKDPDEQNKAVHEDPEMKEAEPHDDEHAKTHSNETHEENKRDSPVEKTPDSEEKVTSACQTTQEGSEARHDSENKGTATDDNEDTTGVAKRRRRRHRKHQEEQQSPNAEPRRVELVDSETQAELRGEKQKKKKRRHRTNGEMDQSVNESLNGGESVNSDSKATEPPVSQESDPNVDQDIKTGDESQVHTGHESKEMVESRAVQKNESHEIEKPVADENDKSPDNTENEHQSELHVTQESEPQAIPAEKEPEPQTQQAEDETGHEAAESSKQEKSESNETNPEAVTVTHANDESPKEEDKKSESRISHENVKQLTSEPEAAQEKHDHKSDEPMKADKSESQNEASAKAETVEVQTTHEDDEPQNEIKAESQDTHESEKPSRRKRKAKHRSTRNLDDATQESAHESGESPKDKNDKPQTTIGDNQSESPNLHPPEDTEKNTKSEPSSPSQEPAKLSTSEESQDVADQLIETHDQTVTETLPKTSPTEEAIPDAPTTKIVSDSDKRELLEPSHHDTGNSGSQSSDSQDEGPLQADEQEPIATPNAHEVDETPKHNPKIEYTKDISLESSSSYPESGSSDEHSDHIISRPLVDGKKTEAMESSEFFNASSKTFASENPQSPTKAEEESASETQTWFDGMASNPSPPPPLIKPTPTPMASSRGDASLQRHSLVIRQQPTPTPMASSRGDASPQRQSFIIRQQPTPKGAPVPFPKYQSSAIRTLLPPKPETPKHKEDSPLVKSETSKHKEDGPALKSETPKEEEESPELSDSEIDALTKAREPSEKASPEHLTSTVNPEEKPETPVYKYWTKSMNLCKIQSMTPIDEDDVLPLDSDFELPEPKERESKRERPSITRVTLKQSRGILSESRHHHHHHHHKERALAKTTTTPTVDAKPRNPPLSRFSSVRSPNDTLSQMDHVLSRFLSSTGQVEDEIAHDLRPGSSTYRDRRLTPGVPRLQPSPLTSAIRTPRSTARQIRVTPDRPRRHEVRWL